MNNLHRYINFPIELFNDPIPEIKSLFKKHSMSFDKNNLGHFRLPLKEIPREFNLWFHESFPSLYIKDWEVFYIPTGEKLPIHSGGIQRFINFIKFNYVYDGENSLMSWYELEKTSPSNQISQK